VNVEYHKAKVLYLKAKANKFNKQKYKTENKTKAMERKEINVVINFMGSLTGAGEASQTIDRSIASSVWLNFDLNYCLYMSLVTVRKSGPGPGPGLITRLP